MITGCSETIKLDRFFTVNYDKLKQFCIEKKIEIDLLNEIYCKLRTMLSYSATTITNHMSYIKKALYTTRLDKYRSKENRLLYLHAKRIDNNNVTELNEIENKLIEIDETARDDQLYSHQVGEISSKLFRFIENHPKINNSDFFIFRAYYLNNITYKELASMDYGLTVNKIKGSISKIKKIIKSEFLN